MIHYHLGISCMGLSTNTAKCMFSVCISFCFFCYTCLHAITNGVRMSDGLLATFTVYFFNYSKSLGRGKQ